ncbi:hypothetical protein OHB00_40590 [Streptomyces sp. NBC_00631]|uniref:hypothetical protein n=1 Tax=Streptomyces sp. NBC_00631 TaxID=2975793 RepID=UPI0030E593D9
MGKKKDPYLDANADQDNLPDYLARGAGGEYVLAAQNTLADTADEHKKLNDSPWQGLETMIVGGSGQYLGQPVLISNDTNQRLAADTSNPATLSQLATAFDQAEKTYRAVGNSMHKVTEALTGDNGIWQGPAARSFDAMMKVAGDQLLANADAMAATPFRPSLAQQVADSGATLQAAIDMTIKVDEFYGKQLAAVSGIVIGDSSGKQTHGRFAAFLEQLERLLKQDLITIIYAVNSHYQPTVATVVPPTDVKNPFVGLDGGTDSTGGSNTTSTGLPDELNNLGGLGALLGNLGGAGGSGADAGDPGGAGGADDGAGAALPDASSALNGLSELSGLGGSGGADTSDSAGSGEGLGTGDASLSDSGISPVASGISGLDGLSGLGDSGGTDTSGAVGSGEGLGTGDASLSDSGISPVASGISGLNGLSGLGKAGSSSTGKDKSVGSAGLSGLSGLSDAGTDLSDQVGIPSASASGLTGLDDAASKLSPSESALDTGGIPTVGGAASDTDLAALGGAGTSTGTGSTAMSLGDGGLAASSAPITGTVTAGSAGTSASGGMPYMPMGGMGGAGAAAGAQGAGERSEASGLMSRASDAWDAGLDLGEDGLDSAIGVSAGGAVLTLSGAGAGTADSAADEAAPVAPAVGMPYLPMGGMAAGAAHAGQGPGSSSTERPGEAGVSAARQEPWTASEEELLAADAQFAAGAEPGAAALDLPRTAEPAADVGGSAMPTAAREGDGAVTAAAADSGTEPGTAAPDLPQTETTATAAAGAVGTAVPAAQATSAAVAGSAEAVVPQPSPADASAAPATAAAAATAPPRHTASAAAHDGVPDDETAAWAVAPGALLPLLWQGRYGRGQAEREQGSPEPGSAAAGGARAEQDVPDGGSGRAIWRPEQSSTTLAPDRITQETGGMTMAQAVTRMQEAIDRAESEEPEGGQHTDADSSSGEATPPEEGPDQRRDIAALLRQDDGAWGSPTRSNLFT